MTQIGIISKETRPSESQSVRRYLLGLSLGTSSTVLLHILNEYVEGIISKGRRTPFDLHVVCIDTNISGRHDEQFYKRVASYSRLPHPRIRLEVIPLQAVLGIKSIDWSSLPSLRQDLHSRPDEQLQDLFDRLPSTTSRADILRLLIRHLLIDTALSRNCQAILFGHSTTALAELTLSETAKGRGFSLAWQINDGLLPVHDFSDPSKSSKDASTSIRVHYPLRELFRRELATYGTLTPPLSDLLPAEDEVDKTSSVVSHRDLSIEEVMSRYFADVEENYPSIVANVVRTTAKLSRLDAEERCGVCGMTLDELGDERWKGEIGDDGGGEESRTGKRLCYGCERSVHG